MDNWNNWQLSHLDDIDIYQSRLLLDMGLVAHGFSTRRGGVSQGNYQSLNMAFHVGDSPDLVNKNREIFSAALQVDKSHWVTLNQCHTDIVVQAQAGHAGRGSGALTNVLADADGLITNVPKLPLVTFYADCIPIYIVDPKNKAIGLAHAGWKGTVSSIGVKTLEKMSAAYGTVPADCLVAIGPGIGGCCYEIDEYLYNRVKESFPQFLDKVCSYTEDNNKWQLYLTRLNWLLLKSWGIKEGNISWSSECTKCNPDLFFSYRFSGGCTGRMAALLMLR